MTRLIRSWPTSTPYSSRRCGLDVADAHPARVQGDDLLVEAREAALVLAHDLRLERALTVARLLDPDRAVLGVQRFPAATVAGVADAAGRRLPRLVTEVLAQLGVHRAFD